MVSKEYELVDGEKFTIHHNGDYSGDVYVIIRNPKRIERSADYTCVEIPFEVLRRMVLDYIRNKAVTEIKSADYDKLEVLAQGE